MYRWKRTRWKSVDFFGWNEKLPLSGDRLVQCKWCKIKIHRDWNGARNNGLCMCTAGGYFRTSCTSFIGNNENGKIAKSKKFLFTQSFHEVEEEEEQEEERKPKERREKNDKYPSMHPIVTMATNAARVRHVRYDANETGER